MQRRSAAAAGLAGVGLWVGLSCAPDLEKQSQLLRVRVLAIKAEPPELNLTSGLPPPVAFTVLPYPDAEQLTLRLALCAPGNPFDGTLDCPGKDGLDLPTRILDPASPDLQAFVAQRFGGLSGIDGGINIDEPGVEQVVIGYELRRIDAGTDPADSERGVYRLAVRFSGLPNHNPQLLDVSLPDGGPLEGAVLPLNQELRLRPRIPDGGPGGIETYVGLDGGLQYERFSYSWQATAGDVVDFRSAEPTPQTPDETNDSRFDTQGTAEPITFYVVVRDLRGGTDWVIRHAYLGSGPPDAGP
jgi:hypothetical protein